MNTRERLIELMTDYGLDRRELGELLKARRDTIDRWLLSNESRNQEEVPEMAVELLELKLKDRPRRPATTGETI
jgi:hypothetical protein